MKLHNALLKSFAGAHARNPMLKEQTAETRRDVVPDRETRYGRRLMRQRGQNKPYVAPTTCALLSRYEPSFTQRSKTDVVNLVWSLGGEIDAQETGAQFSRIPMNGSVKREL